MRHAIVLTCLCALAAGTCAAEAAWSVVPRSGATPRSESSRASIPPLYNGETDTNHIDILIVVDASAKRWLTDSNRTISAFAEFCIADMNTSLGHTGLSKHFTFRLAGVMDVSPADFSDRELSDVASSFTTVLGGREIDDTIADSIRSKRDESNADIVAILTIGKNPIIYGYSKGLTAQDMTAEGLGISAYRAYCICRIDAIEQRHVLLHEIGHLLGAGHCDTQKNAPGPQLFEYSSAYRFSVGGKSLTTITGYPELFGGTIMPFFSSPDYELSYADETGVVHGGIPIGTASNDNSRTVAATYPLVAQYRVALPTANASELDRQLSFALKECGTATATGDSITMHAGVFHSFEAIGVRDGVRISTANLPQGMAFDAGSGVVSGSVKHPGSTTAVFTFQEGSEPMQVFRRISFNVTPLPKWATGTFESVDGDSTISISEKGRISFSAHRRSNKSPSRQDGFEREEVADDGNPVFVIDDNIKLSLEDDGKGGTHGVITSSNGTRYFPVVRKNRQRREKLHKSIKTRQKNRTKPTRKEQP